MCDFIRLTNTIGKTTCSLYNMRLTYSSFLNASITAKKRVIACHFPKPHAYTRTIDVARVCSYLHRALKICPRSREYRWCGAVFITWHILTRKFNENANRSHQFTHSFVFSATTTTRSTQKKKHSSHLPP